MFIEPIFVFIYGERLANGGGVAVACSHALGGAARVGGAGVVAAEGSATTDGAACDEGIAGVARHAWNGEEHIQTAGIAAARSAATASAVDGRTLVDEQHVAAGVFQADGGARTQGAGEDVLVARIDGTVAAAGANHRAAIDGEAVVVAVDARLRCAGAVADEHAAVHVDGAVGVDAIVVAGVGIHHTAIHHDGVGSVDSVVAL